MAGAGSRLWVSLSPLPSHYLSALGSQSASPRNLCDCAQVSTVKLNTGTPSQLISCSRLSPSRQVRQNPESRQNPHHPPPPHTQTHPLICRSAFVFPTGRLHLPTEELFLGFDPERRRSWTCRMNIGCGAARLSVLLFFLQLLSVITRQRFKLGKKQ